ncbi:Universal stress protein F [Thalassovita gelatinovora]|uniref:Universal stress protein F n=1 Tax=Thalassovita gelatinovora TaxID=53501 RepID=A0A0P1FGW9_THAGE|nr:universal stress protein [Thalassovita gelatinovora]QIZ81927.1 universal stress protein [Thalassovita gelatinovora]CUH67302.1 Universal stress protein F [Thalassovita gelatinovora]SEP76656.1 Nucleotide-binding universal stress protein, UspA family [Thalassovita gelatinovora]
MYENVLVPVSFEENRDSIGALEIAGAIRSDTGKITLLHVMEEVPGYALTYIPADFHDSAQLSIAEELTKIAGDIENINVRVVDGHSGRTIVDYAEENGIDCIVIASHRPGMQNLLLGSTATQVVRHAKCAVHVLR